MTTQPRTEGPSSQPRWNDALKPVTALSTGLGLVSGAAALLKDPSQSLSAVAMIAFLIAAASGTAYVVRNRNRPVPLWVLVSSIAVLGLLGSVGWVAFGRDGDPTRTNPGPIAIPSPSTPGSTTPGPTTPGPTTPGPTTPAPDPTTPATSGARAVCGTLRTPAKVVTGLLPLASGPRLTEASYTLTPTSTLFLEWAGRIQGRPPVGSVLWLVGTADPKTVDSTPDHNPGTPYYLLVGQVKPDESGCWGVGRKKAAYDCAGGITFRYSLAMMSEQEARELTDRAAKDLRKDGFPPEDFLSQPLNLLQQFDVPTPAVCG